MFSRIWNWVKGVLGLKKQKNPTKIPQIEVPNDTQSEPQKIPELDPVLEKKTKIAIIVGHTAKRPGAINYKKESEFSFNSRIAEKVKNIMKEKYPNKNVKIFYRPEGYYSAAVRQVGKEVGKWKALISLELHFNSFKKEAYGCEILMLSDSKNAEKTARIADKITDDLASEFNLSERRFYKFKDGTIGDGVKPLLSKDRGALNLKYVEEYGVKHAMLIEPCFANTKQHESIAIFENEDKYANFLADQLAKIDA